MFSKTPQQNPFKSQMIKKPLSQITELLVHPLRFNTVKINYLNEGCLQQSSSANDETVIFIWLSRIKRYLTVRPEVKKEDSKENTATLLLAFLENLDELQESTQQFLCTDNDALNCLIITLLLSEKTEQWETCLQLVKEYNPSMHLLLQWYFNSFIQMSVVAEEEVIRSLQKQQNTKEQVLLPYSPISSIFQFVALSRAYIQNPKTNFSSLIALSPPFHKLEVLATINLHGFIAAQFTGASQINDYLDIVKQVFRTQFDVFTKMHLVRAQPLLKTKPYKEFLAHFILDTLHDIELLEQEEQLLGISQMIRFNNPAPLNFQQQIYSKGLVLTEKLFTRGLYTETYLLHDHITAFVLPENKAILDARSALYCFCHHVEQWLLEQTSAVAFSNAEIPLINTLKKGKLKFKLGEHPNIQLNVLAKRIALHLIKTQVETSLKEWKAHYRFLEQYLEHQQVKEIDKLFADTLELPESENKTLASAKRKRNRKTAKNRLAPTQSNPTMLSSGASGSEQTDILPEPLEHKPEQIILIDETTIAPTLSSSEVIVSATTEQTTVPIPLLPIEGCSTPEQIEVVSAKISPEVGSVEQQEVESTKNTYSCSFFAEKSNELYLARKQMPLELMRLIDELRAKLPNAIFYLTGAAPWNLLNGMKPNDYDLLVLNASQDELQGILHSKNIYAEARSRKHPILYCKLSAEIIIDFTTKDLPPSQSTSIFLESDYLQRDFRQNAFYVQFTDEEQFLLFSFSNALENRHIIDTVAKNPFQALTTDPTRLFRLAKLLISNPNLTLAEPLNAALIKLKSYWIYFFKEYIKQEEGNAARLDLAIRKLFVRYSFAEINLAFHRLQLLAILTGNSAELCSEACAKIPDTTPTELKYQAWIIANSLQFTQENQQKIYVPLAYLMAQTNIESFYFAHLNQVLQGEPHEALNNAYLDDLLQAFSLGNITAKLC